MARTESILDENEVLLVQALDALTTSGASQAIRKSSATTLANVNLTTHTHIRGEVVSGSGTSWTLTQTPTGNISLFAQGTALSVTRGDYSIVGANITTAVSYAAGDLEADYEY